MNFEVLIYSIPLLMRMCALPSIFLRSECPDWPSLTALTTLPKPSLQLLGQPSLRSVSTLFFAIQRPSTISLIPFIKIPWLLSVISFDYCIICLLCVIYILDSVTPWKREGPLKLTSDWFANLEVICLFYDPIVFLSCFNSIAC